MGKQKGNPVLWCLPSLTDLAFVMPMILVFSRLGGAKHLLLDGDTGWHIRAGDWIRENGRVPDRDIFSYTMPDEPWFAWEWLWDVIFSWLHANWGMAAVVAASMLVISVTSALLYRLVRRKCSNVLIAIGVVFLVNAASTIHWLARPHLFTLLFLVVFYSLLERVRDGRTRLLWLLPPLTIVWTNLHGGFFVGIVLIGMYAAGELAAWLFEADGETRRTALARSKPYLITAAACAAASLINPYSYQLHVHIYRYLTDRYHFEHISEFQSLNFQHPVAFYFEPLLALAMVAVGWSLYKRRFAYPLILVGFAHLALMSVRNIPIFMLLAAPIVAGTLKELLALVRERNVASWLKKTAAGFQSFAADIGEMDAAGRIPLASAAAGALLVALFYLAPQAPLLRAEYDPEKYPAGALEVLRVPDMAQRIFTHDEWGDYLIYRLFPETKVFVDGRSDFYGAEFGKAFLNVMRARYDWSQTLDSYSVDTVLLPVDAPLASTLKESPKWRPVYDDGKAIVFRSRGSLAASASRPEGVQASAAHGGGVPAAAGPLIQINTNVADRSRYARR
ncbi:MAG TPA: hypothetical protein PLP04_14380 [Bryobacteraceae bacterium]|nr:hypothetical protein [Bryobacteraceae bacterium]